MHLPVLSNSPSVVFKILRFLYLVCKIWVLTLYNFQRRISQKHEISKQLFLEDFCLFFCPLSNGTIGFDFFDFHLLLTTKFADVSKSPSRPPTICHSHFLVSCSNQKTDSLIKLLLTSLCTQEQIEQEQIQTLLVVHFKTWIYT